MQRTRVTTRRIAVLAALCVASVLFVGTVAVADTPAPRATTWAAQETSFVSKINAERSRRNLRRLALDLQLTRVARGWSTVMTDQDRMYHNPRLGDQVRGDWTRLGENVGYSAATGATPADLVERLHTAFMNSPGHRANVLGDYNRVGVGVRIAGDGTMWVTVNFSKAGAAGSDAALRDAAADARAEFPSSTARTGRHAAYAVVAPAADRALVRSGAALAADDAPLLLTTSGTGVDPNPVLHPASRAAIDHVLGHGGTVYVLGDRDGISPRVESELVADGYRVRRLTTAAAAANAALSLHS
jgi:uncharacterized protein YkwD